MSSSSRVLVVGAGISGVACARRLQEHGVAVEVLDRGHRVGGRMSSRTLAGRPVDTGASYFTVSDDGFAAVVTDWQRRGLAHEWTDTFSLLPVPDGRHDPETKQGPVRWGAPGGLRSLVEDLATGLDVRHEEVRQVGHGDECALVDGRANAGVVLAMPDPQARRLLCAGLGRVAGLLEREFAPTLALSAVYAERDWDPAQGRFDGGFVNDDEVLSWVADDGRRRGDDAPVLVAHSTPDFAASRLEDPAASRDELVAALARVMRLDAPPVETHVQRWSFAKPTGEREAPFLLEEVGRAPLAVCGDGWGPVSKVEGAWVSGTRLADALVEHPRVRAARG